MTMTAPAAASTTSTASELGALLAQHPVGWWLAGVLALALLSPLVAIDEGLNAVSRTVAGVGVVGPTHMDYPGTIASVRAVAQYLSRILDEN